MSMLCAAIAGIGGGIFLVATGIEFVSIWQFIACMLGLTIMVRFSILADRLENK